MMTCERYGLAGVVSASWNKLNGCFRLLIDGYCIPDSCISSHEDVSSEIGAFGCTGVCTIDTIRFSRESGVLKIFFYVFEMTSLSYDGTALR